MLVVVTARDLRRNALFELPLFDYQDCRSPDYKVLTSKIRLSVNQEYGSDDDEPRVHEDEHDKVILPGDDAIVPEFMLDGFIFGPQEFEQIVARLPKSISGYKVKYELFDGKLCIRTVPSNVHGSVVGVFNHTVTSWARFMSPSV